MAESTLDLPEMLRTLGFRASKEALAALITHATKSRLSPAQTLEQIIVLERRERDARNLARRTKLATLGRMRPLDSFDWHHPRKIDRGLYEALLALDFVEQRHNVLFRGPSGVGKSTLAQNLGLEALKRGYSVRFTTLAAALADLLKQESLPALERRIRRYTQPALLILDEIGYLPCDSRAADLLFNVISRRHEERSTVITTNLPFKSWGTIFPGAACVAALVDRFTENCHVLDIDGDSWRQRKAD
jgi:DNA replication protein DnaC